MKLRHAIIFAILSLGIFAMGFAHFRTINRFSSSPHLRPVLKVGFLPVTCHLTCPVLDFASRKSAGVRFESQRFIDFASIVEAMRSGDLQASFIIAPLAMKLREQGTPVKIVYLGHRDGSELIVARNGEIHSFADLRGKRLAIPSRYSNQYLVLRKLLEDANLQPADVNFEELPPPDMPASLKSGSIDGYFVGEPFAAKAELDGSGRVLAYAKDIWPHFISCVLVVNENLITEHPDEVRQLVAGIAESGMWAQSHRLEAASLVAPFYRQDEKLLRYVLTTPPDRVSYTSLTPDDNEIAKIGQMALSAGLLDKSISLTELVDREFVPKSIRAIDPVDGVP